MNFVRTTSTDPEFKKLVFQLDQLLQVTDGEDHAFFAQYNTLGDIKNVVLCYEGEIAIGCGAFKEYVSGTAEIKRMFVLPEYRGKGAASGVLAELESWVKELRYKKCILETGEKLQNAIALYLRSGYVITENYGQYIDVESSVCMQKII